MSQVSEQRLFEALATLSRACAEGGLPDMTGASHDPAAAPAIAAMDEEAREVLAEASLAIAFGAFASRGGDSGPIHLLIGAMGLMAMLSGEEPDPPAEILAIAAQDDRVEREIDRAGEAVDAEFGRDATCEAVTGALEARLLGTAIQFAGCTLPEGVTAQAAVRLRAARCLTRLAAGMLAMNVAGAKAGFTPAAEPPPAA